MDVSIKSTALALVLMAAAGMQAAARAQEPLPAVDQLLRAALAGSPPPPAVRRHGERLQAWTALQDFYRRRGFALAWWDVAGEKPAVGRLLAALDEVAGDGLDPRLYPAAELREALAKVRGSLADTPGAMAAARGQLAALDVELSYTFLALAAHLAIGRVQPAETVKVGWHTRPPEVDLVAALQRAVEPPQEVAATLAALAPGAAGYTGLRRALAVSRAQAAAGGGEPSLAGRIRQIELNMERWRWLPDLGDRYVLVNVPDFRLAVVDGDREVMSMRVIVGKAQRRTPVFSDLMSQIVLNPAWHVPDSIAAHELAPALLRDRGYLKHEGIEIRRGAAGEAVDPGKLGAGEIAQLGRPGSPFRLVQPPGPHNALGRYKFVFPNQYDVYLHDTPNGKLFSRDDRELSHGCVRVEEPAALAAYLLADDARWTPQAVAAQIASGRTATIPLARPIAVHILYLTAWVDGAGTLELRRDIYGHDAWLDAALAAEMPLWEDLDGLRAALAGGR